MIRLPVVPLPRSARGHLRRWQAEIDAEADYAARVERGKRRFSSQNRRSSATFREVKLALTRMCSGARRCVYCEDSVADEVEHIRPKDLYPEAVFDWENYVYACGPCNGRKNNHFAVITPQGELRNLTRGREDPVEPPQAGDPALLNPRTEDPLQLMVLDLRTYGFDVLPEVTGRDRQRAEYTLKVLALRPGDRDYLRDAWAAAAQDYLAHLGYYAMRKQQGAPYGELQERIQRIRTHQHPTIWWEMKRQRHLIPEVNTLFAQVPEALDW